MSLRIERETREMFVLIKTQSKQQMQTVMEIFQLCLWFIQWVCCQCELATETQLRNKHHDCAKRNMLIIVIYIVSMELILKLWTEFNSIFCTFIHDIWTKEYDDFIINRISTLHEQFSAQHKIRFHFSYFSFKSHSWNNSFESFFISFHTVNRMKVNGRK